MTRNAALLSLAIVALLAAVPLVAERYVLSVLILVFHFAYVGQAWNVMMGYAGQLSLGHALYIGIGAYVSALLWLNFGVSPWIGVFAGVAAAMIRDGLARAAAAGWQGVFVVGDPAYYGRFGFDAAAACGFVSPYAGPHFMLLRLDPTPDLPRRGAVAYAPAFAALG